VAQSSARIPHAPHPPHCPPPSRTPAHVSARFGRFGCTGSFAASTYKKIVGFASEKDLLPKAKTVTDKVVSALVAVDNNYQITAKIDEQLLISEKVTLATDKITDLKSSVTSKVSELTAAMK